MPKLAFVVSPRDGVIAAIDEHVVAGDALTSSRIVVWAYKSAPSGVVISALEVVKTSLLISALATERKTGGIHCPQTRAKLCG